MVQCCGNLWYSLIFCPVQWNCSIMLCRITAELYQNGSQHNATLEGRNLSLQTALCACVETRERSITMNYWNHCSCLPSPPGCKMGGSRAFVSPITERKDTLNCLFVYSDIIHCKSPLFAILHLLRQCRQGYYCPLGELRVRCNILIHITTFYRQNIKN